MQFREPDFESLVRSIVYQQLSGRVASVIFGRLSKATGANLTPHNILKLRPSRMRTLGLSTQKTAYIRDLARHTRDGTLVFDELRTLPDADVIERLTQVKGVGVWTAHMFLMFALRRTDVLPVGDLGIRTAIRKAYGLAEMPQPAEMLCMHRGGCWIVAHGNKALGQRVAEEVCDKLNPIDSGSMSERWSVHQTQSFGNVQLLFVTNASL